MPSVPLKRFYERASVAEVDGRFGIALDGRLAQTPRGKTLTVPTRALAHAIAGEWAEQGEVIRPLAMPLTRLVYTALDRVAGNRAGVVADAMKIGGADLMCYRAEAPAALAARQDEGWQPLLDWAAARHAARLSVTRGIVPVVQPEEAMRALRAALESLDDLVLAALASAAAACGSLVIALALVEGRLDADGAFAASEIDESFERERWGADPEDEERRRQLRADIDAASRVVALGRSSALPAGTTAPSPCQSA